MKILAPVSWPFLALSSGIALHLGAQTPSAEFARAVRPFIQKNCQSCHNTNLPSGSVDLQQMLAAPGSLAEQHDTWEKVAYVLRSGQMPPKTALQPSDADPLVDNPCSRSQAARLVRDELKVQAGDPGRRDGRILQAGEVFALFLAPERGAGSTPPQGLRIRQPRGPRPVLSVPVASRRAVARMKTRGAVSRQLKR